MNLHHLQLFIAVVEAGGFTRAAQACHISQQAVSLQVRRLEEDLGFPLFTRQGRRLTLTPEGTQVYERALAIMEMVRNLGQFAETVRAQRRPTVRVLCSSTPGAYIAPVVLPSLQERYPEIDIDLRVMKTVDMPEALNHMSHLDFAVFVTELSSDRLSVEPIGRDELWLVAHHTHPLAAHRGPIPLPRLVPHRLVLRRGHCDIGRRLMTVLHQHGLNPQVTYAGSIEACRTAVTNGYGITYLSRFAVADSVAAGVLKRLDVPELEYYRNIYLGRLPGRPLSEPARFLLDLICARLRGEAPPQPHSQTGHPQRAAGLQSLH